MNCGGAASFQIFLISCVCLSGCVTEPRISYQKDVQPIFLDKCTECHKPPYGDGYRKTGLDMGSYEALMAGSIYGRVVVPGESKMSPLNMLVEGRAGSLSRLLEDQHRPLTGDEIKVLRLWVEQGARSD
jgi:hypothetical protein